MKNNRMEYFIRSARAYHARSKHAWHHGHIIYHCYDNPREKSWWDDVGFVLNGVRHGVYWQHPRDVYRIEIENIARGMNPKTFSDPDGWLRTVETQYKKLGRSRKKALWHRCAGFTQEERDHYNKIRATEEELSKTGIDFIVVPSINVTRNGWSKSVELVAPIEVRTAEEAVALANFARRLVKGETTLDKEFPGFQYTKDTWLSERKHD